MEGKSSTQKAQIWRFFYQNLPIDNVLRMSVSEDGSDRENFSSPN